MNDVVVPVFLVAIFFAFGLVGHLLARRRGGREGFISGAILGPLGWLLILARKDERRKCGQCGGVVPGDAAKCMHCGSELSEGYVAPKHLPTWIQICIGIVATIALALGIGVAFHHFAVFSVKKP